LIDAIRWHHDFQPENKSANFVQNIYLANFIVNAYVMNVRTSMTQKCQDIDDLNARKCQDIDDPVLFFNDLIRSFYCQK
jgi:hypothetical protein